MRKDYFKIKNTTNDIKQCIIESECMTPQELNKEILNRIKKDFESFEIIAPPELSLKSSKRCVVSLNNVEEKIVLALENVYGIKFSVLYAEKIMEIAIEKKIILHGKDI